jgi:hypothetical protein
MQRKTRFAEGVGGRTSAREGAESRLRLSETFGGSLQDNGTHCTVLFRQTVA